MYEKARKGIIKGMTGVDDPYEEKKKIIMVNMQINMVVAMEIIMVMDMDIIMVMDMDTMHIIYNS